MSIVFWSYHHLHIKRPLFVTEDLHDLTIKLRDVINKYRYHLINDSLAVINIHKVYKTNYHKFIDDNNPFWDLNTRIIDYMNYYEIKTKKIDMIISITRH